MRPDGLNESELREPPSEQCLNLIGTVKTPVVSVGDTRILKKRIHRFESAATVNLETRY